MCTRFPSAGKSEGACGWQLSLPVLDPSCLLTLAVFHQPSRGQRAPGQRRPGILYNNPQQVWSGWAGLPSLSACAKLAMRCK